MRVWGGPGIGSWVCFSLFMVSACYWRGRLCSGRGRDTGFVLYISIFWRVLGWWVCVCLYMLVHTHKLLGYLMWAQVWDGHLESQKNSDRLKRIIHVDRIGVHSTFVYIYAVLRVLMIWDNCIFRLTCLFCWKAEDVTTISKSQSLTSESIKDCTLRVPKQNYYIISLRAIKQSNLHSHYAPKKNRLWRRVPAALRGFCIPVTIQNLFKTISLKTCSEHVHNFSNTVPSLALFLSILLSDFRLLCSFLGLCHCQAVGCG